MKLDLLQRPQSKFYNFLLLISNIQKSIKRYGFFFDFRQMRTFEESGKSQKTVDSMIISKSKDEGKSKKSKKGLCRSC